LPVNRPQSVNAARLRNARGERKVLQEKFGESYAAYRRSTWF
jgi:protein-S-isoprenylcysteine O-methyltransferase Ste14